MSTAALSYALLANERGRGYATLAVQRVLAVGSELGFLQFEIRADIENTRSRRVAERAGFKREQLCGRDFVYAR